MQVCLLTLPPEGHGFWRVKWCHRLPQVQYPDTAPHCPHPTENPHYHPWQQAPQPRSWKMRSNGTLWTIGWRMSQPVDHFQLLAWVLVRCYSPKSWVWVGNQKSDLVGTWFVGRLVLPEASEPNKEGSGLRERQKNVRAHRSSRERSITPTEGGESGSHFTFRDRREKTGHHTSKNTVVIDKYVDNNKTQLVFGN